MHSENCGVDMRHTKHAGRHLKHGKNLDTVNIE